MKSNFLASRSARPISVLIPAIAALCALAGFAPRLAATPDLGAGHEEVVIGTGNEAWNYPLHSLYRCARTQTIYRADEIGGAERIMGLGLDVTKTPGPVLSNFSIRMKHTGLSVYGGSPEWENSGWTVVYQADRTIAATGWVVFSFPAPFEFNGVDNLLVDISFRNSGTSSHGEVRYSTPGGTRSLTARSLSSTSDPILWSGGSPTPSSSTYVSNIKLLVASFRPAFEPDGGTYHTDQIVTIASSEPGATIRYTLDGTDPSAESPVIVLGEAVLVTVDPPTVLKARAWLAGGEQSKVREAHYRRPTVHYVSPSGDDAGDGLSWATAKRSVQAAIDMANATDEVWLEAGTYKPTTGTDRTLSIVMKEGVNIYGGFAFNETDFSNRDWNENVTVLSGDLLSNDGSTVSTGHFSRQDNSYHVVWGANNAILDGVVVTGGNASATSGNDSRGGGLFIASGISGFTVRNSVFSANSAHSGGGIYTYGDLDLINCAFLDNAADSVSGLGGAIFSNDSSSRIADGTFLNNSAKWGGAIRVLGGHPVIANCTFTGNTGYSGGAIHMRDFNLATIASCRFTGNRASDEGGAIFAASFAHGQSPHKIRGSYFESNTAGGRGGAIHNERLTFHLSNSHFRENSVTTWTTAWGGAIYNYACTVRGFNSVFEGNTSVRSGGAIHNYQVNIELANCLFVGNRAHWAGGMQSEDTRTTLTNCTFVANKATDLFGGFHSNVYLAASVANSIFHGNSDSEGSGESSQITLRPGTVEHNLIEGLATFAGVGNIDSDPLFIRVPDLDSGDYGDLRLRTGSPGIDAGDTAALPADILDIDGNGNTAEPLPIDLAGRTRVLGAAVDMGAYEASTVRCYSDWAASIPDPEDRLPDASISGGMANLLRYAFGVGPLDDARERLPRVVPDGEGRPLMRFYRDTVASDLEVEVQVSRDLIGWQVLARGRAGEPMEADPIHGFTVSEEPFGEDLRRVSVTWDLAGEGIVVDPRQFFRVQARLLPLDGEP